MGKRLIMGRILELKFKGKRDMRPPPRTRYWKISRTVERAVKKLKRNDCGKKEETGDTSSCNPYKMEMMQEDGGGGGKGRRDGNSMMMLILFLGEGAM
jgi:hypothetical protein